MGADETAGVRIVDHDQRAVTWARSQTSLSRQAPSMEKTPSVRMSRVRRAWAALRPRFELVEIVVGVAQAARFAEPDAVDDAGVIQCIADDRVVLVEQRSKSPPLASKHHK